MHKHLTVTVAALAFASVSTFATAQEKTARVGIITGGPIEVIVAKGKLWQERGSPCVLRPGDHVGFIADVADTNPAMVVVHKQFDSGMHFRIGRPDLTICLRGKDVFMPKAQFEQAAEDFATQQEQKAKQGPKKSTKGVSAKN